MDVSIIICTYNPEERIFGRCLTAVKHLKTEGVTAEIILVDNNSVVPIASLHYVSAFLRDVAGSMLIMEKEQGLSYARIAGFRRSSGKLIVFFDDDNEPFPDFIKQAKHLHENRCFIGIIGPGFINVEYIDEVDPWIMQHMNPLFQEKKAEREEYVLAIMTWAPWYPPGTGQVMKRVIFESYLENFYQKGLTTSDRKGQDLSSAGDSQMIWSSLNLNYAVGHHPALKLNHLIPAKRANLAYLKRLKYHLELSGTSAFVEMYPEKKSQTAKYSTSIFLYDLFKVYFNAVVKMQPKSINLNIATLIGRNEASIRIYQHKMPFMLQALKRATKIK